MRTMIMLVTLLAACSDSSTPSGADLSTGATNDVEQLCVDTINMYRATLGLAAYARWNDGESCADGEAESDSMTGTAHGAFGTCGEHAQDECPGWPAPSDTAITGCLAQMWAEGPGSDFSTHGHYINMSSTQYTKAACGFHLVGSNMVWSTQNFE